MKIASVCSGVGGLDLGLDRAGHETVALCEADARRRTVLARHWADTPIHPDLPTLHAQDLPPVAMLVGGTPCQDLSHAGRRAGLDGERSALFHHFIRLRRELAEEHGTRWSLWENVYGALTSDKGRDFARVLHAHVGGHVGVPTQGKWPRAGRVVGPAGVAEWRVLDAQYFGVPQRRRRVFVVSCLGARSPLEVLLDREGGERHLEARGEAPAASSAGPTRRADDARGGVASALRASLGGVDDNAAQARHIVAGTLTTGGPAALDDSAVGGRQLALAFHMTQDPIAGAVSPALGAGAYATTGAQIGATVRRLTPTECERLMGWPDGWTHLEGASLLAARQSWPGGPAPPEPKPDGFRYAACGDGVAAPVAEWIGHGINHAQDVHA